MRKVFLLLFCALCLSMVAQTNVAVYVSGLDDTYDATKKIIGSELATGIVAMSEYIAVDRTEDFLTSVKTARGTDSIAEIDEQQILELGKQYGAKIVCVAKIMPYQNTFYIQARMQNANNAKILSTARVSSTLGSLDEILNATETLTNNLITQLNSRREEAKQRELEQERLNQLRTQQEQELQAQEQARRAQEQALEEQRRRESMERSQAQLSESLNQLGDAINQYRQVKNSYIL